jgi:hypothetical protein
MTAMTSPDSSGYAGVHGCISYTPTDQALVATMTIVAQKETGILTNALAD